MSALEKLFVKWNNFQTAISLSFQDLRRDQEFTDVTLVCGDKRSFEAHKVLLASVSEVLENILLGKMDPHPLFVMKQNKHHQTLIYMKGTSAKVLLIFFILEKQRYFKKILTAF